VHKYGDLIYQMWKKKNKLAHHIWHLDKTFIKVKGEWYYLHCAIDQDGYTLDIQLCNRILWSSREIDLKICL